MPRASGCRLAVVGRKDRSGPLALRLSSQVKSLNFLGPRPSCGKGSISVPQTLCRDRLGAPRRGGSEQPGTQGPGGGAGGLWVPVPALPCPQPPPPWPRRLAVSGARAPGVICTPGRALPTPGRRAAPALSKDAALARAEPTSPGMHDSPRDLPPDFPPPLVPLPEAIPPSSSEIPLKCPLPGWSLHGQAEQEAGHQKTILFFGFLSSSKDKR